VPGFPIRTPWDLCLVDSSPRPIAASHVLHRLLVPRHSPFALGNLTTKIALRLALTCQRCSRPLCNSQTTANPGPSAGGTPPCGDSNATGSDWFYRRNMPQPGACFFRTQQGVCTSIPAAPPIRSTLPKTESSTRIRGRCRLRLTSVSAIEHPTSSFGWRGLLDSLEPGAP
jgi:hypothetical protein